MVALIKNHSKPPLRERACSSLGYHFFVRLNTCVFGGWHTDAVEKGKDELNCYWKKIKALEAGKWYALLAQD